VYLRAFRSAALASEAKPFSVGSHRLLEGAFHGANLWRALFVAVILINQHELPINRGQLVLQRLIVTRDEEFRGNQLDVFQRRD
jgi:hypothetical protein